MQSIPLIQVVSIIEHEDGGATINFDVSDEFITWYKKTYKKRRFTQKMFERFFYDAIRDLNGLSIRKNIGGLTADSIPSRAKTSITATGE